VGEGNGKMEVARRAGEVKAHSWGPWQAGYNQGPMGTLAVMGQSRGCVCVCVCVCVCKQHIGFPPIFIHDVSKYATV
jgi:hypothetical protein